MSSRRKKLSPDAAKAFMAGFIDYEALDAICARIPALADFQGRNTKIIIPKDLYNTLHKFYGRSLALAEAMDNVLDDGEHKLIYEEAASLGYRLPDIEETALLLDDYKNLLNSFDAYDVKPFKGDQVKMDIATARGHRETILFSNRVLRHLWQGCFETDYMNHFTTLKKAGFPYSGETALQQMVNIAVSFEQADNANTRFQFGRFMKKHFPDIQLSPS